MDVNYDQQAIGRIFAGEPVEHGVHLFAAPKPALVIELNQTEEIIGCEFDTAGAALRAGECGVEGVFTCAVLFKASAAGPKEDQAADRDSSEDSGYVGAHE